MSVDTIARVRPRKRGALIAYDNCKMDLLECARFNRDTLAGHEAFATGTTGARVASDLHLPMTRFVRGPLGGDLLVFSKQVGPTGGAHAQRPPPASILTLYEARRFNGVR